MKYSIIYVFILISCKSPIRKAHDPILKIERIGFISDTAGLRRILYPVDITGKLVSVTDYVDKFLEVRISNLSQSTIFLRGRPGSTWGIDSLQTESLVIDSIMYDSSFVSNTDNRRIRDDFSPFIDSILPSSSKNKVIYIEKKPTQFKGRVIYGKRVGADSIKMYEQPFTLNLTLSHSNRPIDKTIKR